MKIVECLCCMDYIAPRFETWQKKVTWCDCKLSCTWWEIAQYGFCRVWSAKGLTSLQVVGLSRRFWGVMMPESGILQASDVFADINQLAVKVRPDAVPDVLFREPEQLDGWQKMKEGLMARVQIESEPLDISGRGKQRSLGSLLWRRNH
jgi:hypothetical protein